MFRASIGFLSIFLLSVAVYSADNAAPQSLVDFASTGDLQIGPSENSESQVTSAVSDGQQGKVLDVTIKAGKYSYPGISITPTKPWDLSRSGYVEASITNTGKESVRLCLQLANADIDNSSAQNLRIA